MTIVRNTLSFYAASGQARDAAKISWHSSADIQQFQGGSGVPLATYYANVALSLSQAFAANVPDSSAISHLSGFALRTAPSQPQYLSQVQVQLHATTLPDLNDNSPWRNFSGLDFAIGDFDNLPGDTWGSTAFLPPDVAMVVSIKGTEPANVPFRRRYNRFYWPWLQNTDLSFGRLNLSAGGTGKAVLNAWRIFTADMFSQNTPNIVFSEAEYRNPTPGNPSATPGITPYDWSDVKVDNEFDTQRSRGMRATAFITSD